MSAPSGRAEALRALGLVLAVAACYANSLDVPFLMDDFRPWEPLDYSTRPLVWATFDLNRWLTGAETWSYHVVNALVHLASGFLLFAVLRRILARATPDSGASTRDGLAYLTTLLWLCHPLQTATVTYLSQRAEAMGALFYLAAFYAFLRAAEGARPLGWQALTLAALVLGFLSKEIIVTAPALFLLVDALFLATGILAALRARSGFYAAIALTSLVLAGFYIAPLLLSDPSISTSGLKLAAFGPLDYARTQPGVILHYLRLVFWPHPLCFDPGWPIARAPLEWLPQTAVIVALLAATVVLCVRRSWSGFALASFFLVLTPTSSFVPIADPAFEHRMYLPLAAVLALAVVAGWRIAARASSGRALPALSVALVLLSAGLSVLRNQDYRSPVRLWQGTVELAPHHARAHDSLGGALLEAGRTQEAIDELLEALRLDPKAGYVYMNLGIAYMRLEQVDRAIPFFERAAAFGDPQAASALGNALTLKGDHAGAAAWLEQAVWLHPDNARIQYRYAEALERLGRSEEAARHFEEAARLDPTLQRAPARPHANTRALEEDRDKSAE